MGPHPLEKASATDPKQPSGDGAVEHKTIPLYEHHRPHKLDGTVAMAVLLRRIYEKTHVDSNLKGEARQVKVIFAADDATELVKELVLVASLDNETWSEVRNELAHAVRGITHLESEARGPEKTRLARALADLEHTVGAKAFAAATKAIPQADKLPAMNDKERLELAAQAVIAACRQAALFRAMKSGDDMAQARQLMVQMRLHYNTAADAVSAIGDRRLLERLHADVELATQGMDSAERFVTSTNQKLPWDRAFAEGFDAEQHFLRLVGHNTLQKPRVYSGTIDPGKAITDIENLAAGKGGAEGHVDKKFESPQQAVAGIGVVMDEIYHRQNRAIQNATSDIAEPRVPKESSMLDTLLEILIKTALAGAAGAIGSKISAGVTRHVNKALSAKASATSIDVLKHSGEGDYFAAKGAIQQAAGKAAVASGAAATAMKSEGAKDAFKEFFKSSGYKAIMHVIGSGKVPSSNSTNPLQIFSQHSEGVLDQARLEGKMAFIHLAPALGQAEPDALWELYQSLLGQLDAAYTIQYGSAMEEWQNFKARMHHGLAADYSAKDNHAYHERDLQSKADKATGKPVPKDQRTGTSDANVGNGKDEQGALLIEAWINTDDFVGATGEPRVASVRLPGAEDATLKHFRTQNEPLAEVHMNKHFKLKLVAYMNESTVNVGVGADHGLLESTLDKREQAALRVMAAGDRVTHSNVFAAQRGEEQKYSRFSVRDLEKQLEKFIKVIQKSQRMGQLER